MEQRKETDESNMKSWQARGGLTAEQRVNAGKAYMEVPGGTPGALPAYVGPPGSNDQQSYIGLQLRKDPTAVGSTKTREVKTVENGQVVTKIVPDVAGSSFITPPSTDRSQERADKVAAGGERDAWSDFQKLGSDLNVEKASSRTSIGVAANKFQGADRIYGLVGVSPDEVDTAKKDKNSKVILEKKLDSLSPQKKAEVTNALMAQIGTGSGSLAQFEHLNTETAGDRLANLTQYFSQHPVGAESGGIIADNLLSVKNERDISKSYIDKYFANIKNTHPRAFKHDATKDSAETLFNGWVQSQADSVLNEQQPTGQAPSKGGSGTAYGATDDHVSRIDAELKKRGVAPTPARGASGGF